MLRSQLMIGPVALSETSDVSEILWYFSHYLDDRRLSLAQNPQFYAALPISPAGYAGEFCREPITEIQGTIDVLTNSIRRVFLESPNPRIFDDVWVINGILIFRGSCVIFLFLLSLTSSRRYRKARGRNRRQSMFSKHPSHLFMHGASRSPT